MLHCLHLWGLNSETVWLNKRKLKLRRLEAIFLRFWQSQAVSFPCVHIYAALSQPAFLTSFSYPIKSPSPISALPVYNNVSLEPRFWGHKVWIPLRENQNLQFISCWLRTNSAQKDAHQSANFQLEYKSVFITQRASWALSLFFFFCVCVCVGLVSTTSGKEEIILRLSFYIREREFGLALVTMFHVYLTQI